MASRPLLVALVVGRWPAVAKVFGARNFEDANCSQRASGENAYSWNATWNPGADLDSHDCYALEASWEKAGASFKLHSLQNGGLQWFEFRNPVCESYSTGCLDKHKFIYPKGWWTGECVKVGVTYDRMYEDSQKPQLIERLRPPCDNSVPESDPTPESPKTWDPDQGAGVGLFFVGLASFVGLVAVAVVVWCTLRDSKSKKAQNVQPAAHFVAEAPAQVVEARVVGIVNPESNAVVPRVVGKSTSVSAGSGSKPPLAEMVEAFRRDLEVQGPTLVQVVDEACQALGVRSGGNLREKAELCWDVLYAAEG